MNLNSQYAAADLYHFFCRNLKRFQNNVIVAFTCKNYTKTVVKPTELYHSVYMK